MNYRLSFALALVVTLFAAPVWAQDESDYETDELRLADAIDSGSVAAVRRLLDAGASPNTVVYDAPALQWAIWDNRYYVAKLLIDRGADVNLPDADGYTSLMVACVVHDERIARLLLEHHADVNAVELSYGMSPLQVACESGAEKLIDLLLAAGADAKHTDNYGGNCLEEAAFYGYGEIVEKLRKQGLDTQWPLHVACGLGQVEKVKQLLAEGRAADKPNGGWQNTPLHFAAGGGHADVAAILLEQGAKLDARNVLGATPLHASAGADTVDFARWALEHGAPINAADEEGGTPLDWASDQVHKLLTARGAEHGDYDAEDAEETEAETAGEE